MSVLSFLGLLGVAAAAANSVTTTSFCLTGLASTPTSTVTTTTTRSTTTLSTVTVTSKITPVTTIVPPSQTITKWKTVTTTTTLNLAKVTDVYYTYTSTNTITQTNLYTANVNTIIASTITLSLTEAVVVPTPSGFVALGDQIQSLGFSYGNSPYSSISSSPSRRRGVGKRIATVSDASPPPGTSSSQYPQYVICDEIAQVLATTTVRSTVSTTKTVPQTPKTVVTTSTISITNTKTITPKHASTTISAVTSTTLTTQSTSTSTSTSTILTTTTIFAPASTSFAICASNNIVNSVAGQYDLYPYPDADQAYIGGSAGMTPEDCCVRCALEPNCAMSWLIPGPQTNRCYGFYNHNYVCDPTGVAGELYLWDWEYGYTGTYVSNSNCGRFRYNGPFQYDS